MTILRHVAAVVLLPGTVTVAVPLWIARANAVQFIPPRDLASVLVVAAGLMYLAGGLALFAYSVYHFWTRGRGTLAPWDPPRRFVVEGPYRFVRNPMISGVIFILAGEAFILRSRGHAGWAALFVLVNSIYIPLLEEPMLAARFGEPYERYKRDVPRFFPRFRRRRRDTHA